MNVLLRTVKKQGISPFLLNPPVCQLSIFLDNPTQAFLNKFSEDLFLPIISLFVTYQMQGFVSLQETFLLKVTISKNNHPNKYTPKKYYSKGKSIKHIPTNKSYFRLYPLTSFSVHMLWMPLSTKIMSVSRHKQVCLIRLSFERYFSHLPPCNVPPPFSNHSLNEHTCSWHDKLISLWTLNRQAKIFLRTWVSPIWRQNKIWVFAVLRVCTLYKSMICFRNWYSKGQVFYCDHKKNYMKYHNQLELSSMMKKWSLVSMLPSLGMAFKMPEYCIFLVILCWTQDKI